MSIHGNVLITGGSGTLGHAIVRRAERDDWDCAITIYSRSELHQARMRSQYPNLRYILGDVRDYERLSAAIIGHDIVIHAAAMKRIPEAEAQPVECKKTNIDGSENVIKACIAASVAHCIGISTDKACRAVTAYGASKLVMEKLFQSQAQHKPTAFHLVRYGNVVASNGSVIPIWREQAAQGRAMKITDSRCTRFWMSEDMAVDLILVGLEKPAGTILVPKMSKLNIVDMARLIVPGGQLVETGLRSCEKLHEDLVHTDEEALDLGSYYLIGRGSPGHEYTSAIAPTLDADDFLNWVKDSEQE